MRERWERTVWIAVLIVLAGVFNLVVLDSLAFKFLGLGLIAFGAWSLFNIWRTQRRA